MSASLGDDRLVQRQLFEDGSRALTVDLAPPLAFRHPMATHEVLLAGLPVGYVLRRARRRSIGMIVTPEGLKVSAPRWVAVRDIEAALAEKARWILAKLALQRERAASAIAARLDWRCGARLPFLGDTITLALGQGPRRSVVLQGAAGQQQLRLGLPVDAPADKVARAVRKWLLGEALRVFESRCGLYAPGLGVKVTRLALSSARTRWGSASSTGSIRLHWRLVHFAMPTIDYVVVHELAHLREMNHSPRFWALVEGVLPDYEAARADLKSRVLPVIE